MATTISEDGSKKERKNTNRGHVAEARFGITHHDIKYGTEAGKRWLQGNPNYYMKPAPPGTLPYKKA
tara:strand:- start:256 stop:456 length:201 start_codon:yes stop_codon:yes gene_type:complete